MKRIITILCLCIISVTAAFGQHMFTTEGKDIYGWNDVSQKFEFIVNDPNCATLFELNENQTMIKHTISTMSSTYYIKSRKVDEENKVIIYEVVSDVGNRYTFLLDGQSVTVANFNSIPSYYIKFYIKKMFNN